MRKRILFGIGIAISIFVIGSIYRNILPCASNDLEYWIGERVDRTDFSEHTPKHGLMGGREYYGLGYIPMTDENGGQLDPNPCVIYTVTAYPDYISNRSHVTHIQITDPSVAIYGLTTDSGIEDIEKTMKKHCFRMEYSAGGLTARRGRYTFVFSKNAIDIDLKVTNLFGIQF